MPAPRSLSDAELQELLDALAKAQRDAEAIADQLEDRFQRALVRAQGRAAEKLGDIIAEAPDFQTLTTKQRMRWWVDHSHAIDEALVNSGYQNAVTGYVNALPQFIDIVKATASAQGESFLAFSKDTLAFLRARQVQQFTALELKANTALSDLLYGQVFGGMPKKQLLPTLRSTITGSYPWGEKQGLYEWHAGTYARTNHFKYLRELDAAQAEAHGVTENFLYVGPVDEKNRSFCRGILSNPVPIYTRAEIAELNNGFRVTHPEVSDVFTSGGGFNCRHRWLAITSTLADKIRGRNGAAQAEEREPGVDVKTAPKSFKEQKTAADAQQWAIDHGLATDTVNYGGLHVSFVNKLNREMSILTREFPDAAPMFLGSQARALDWLAQQGYRVRRPGSNYGGYFGTTMGGRRLTGMAFPGVRYSSPAAIRRSIEGASQMITNGYMATIPGETDTLRRIIFHEYGHALDGARGIANSVEMAQLLEKWAREHGAMYRLWIRDNLAGYSAQYKWELFSEGFAEYILSPNPRQPARDIGELMMRAYGKPLRKL